MPMPLGSSPSAGAEGYAINSAGVMVGTIDSTVTGRRGFTFLADQFSTLSLIPGASAGEAYGISDADPPTIVGYCQDGVDGDPPLTAVRWINGQPEALVLPITDGAYAFDVNERGQICGQMGGTLLHEHAFIWHEGKAIDLGVIPGGQSSRADAINNHGDVCGSGHVRIDGPPGVHYRAMVYIDGRMQNIGTLPGYLRSYATGINDARQVVGSCEQQQPGATLRPGFIWQNGVMRSLAELTDLPPNIIMQEIRGINNRGQIVATGVDTNAVGVPLTLLLSPPNRATGDVDCNKSIDMDDILGVLGQWGPSIPGTTADFDNDGTVDVDDLMEVLRGWSGS
jgi:probable HAF family extracellular repeat protein